MLAQMVKNLLIMQETWVRSLGQEDILEKGITTHSSILDWRIPWTEKPGRLQSIRWQRDTTERLILPFFKNPVKVCNKFPEAECGLR